MNYNCSVKLAYYKMNTVRLMLISAIWFGKYTSRAIQVHKAIMTKIFSTENSTSISILITIYTGNNWDID